MPTNASVAVILLDDCMRPRGDRSRRLPAGDCRATRRSYASDLRLFFRLAP